MTLSTQEIDALKAHVAAHLVAHKGDTVGDAAVGILDAIDEAVVDLTDPRPFLVGRPVVVIASGATGRVVRRVETAGELHTVIVQIGHLQEPYSPRELEEVAR